MGLALSELEIAVTVTILLHRERMLNCLPRGLLCHHCVGPLHRFRGEVEEQLYKSHL